MIKYVNYFRALAHICLFTLQAAFILSIYNEVSEGTLLSKFPQIVRDYPLVFIFMVFLLFGATALYKNTAWLLLKVQWFKYKKMSPEDTIRIKALVKPLLDTARAKNLTTLTADDIYFFEEKSDDFNAMACGKNVLCITSRVLKTESDSILTGLLAHEIGHLINDQETSLFIYNSGLLLHLIWLPTYLFSKFLALAIKLPVGFWQIAVLIISFVPWIVANLLLIINNIAVLLDNFISRSREYKADNMAIELGVGNELIQALEKIYSIYGDPSKFEFILKSHKFTHPLTINRLKKLSSKVN